MMVTESTLPNTTVADELTVSDEAEGGKRGRWSRIFVLFWYVGFEGEIRSKVIFRKSFSVSSVATR